MPIPEAFDLKDEGRKSWSIDSVGYMSEFFIASGHVKI